MPRTLDQLSPRAGLVEAARIFYERGWMAGTAGNLSVRAPNQNTPALWITASGLPKGHLDEGDFILASVETGTVIEQAKPGQKPSAETSIHRAVYARVPEAKACLHVHSVDGVLAIRRHAPTAHRLRLPALEMLKGFDIWDERPEVELPIFENLANVPEIAAQLDRYLAEGTARVPAAMIRDHGVTVWGRGLQEAFNRLEIMEYLFGFLARATPAEVGAK